MNPEATILIVDDDAAFRLTTEQALRAEGFVIDGEEIIVPMATEEPSVIAAASYAASIASRNGGFRTRATEPVMTAQVFLERFLESRDHGEDADGAGDGGGGRDDRVARHRDVVPAGGGDVAH